MKELIEAASLALQATTQIQDWTYKILQKIESKLKKEYEGTVSIEYIIYPPGSSPLSFPDWAAQLVGASRFKWGVRDFQQPMKFGYYMISFRRKTGDTHWRPFVFWGIMKEVERTVGRFDIRTIARELLEKVNTDRKPNGQAVTHKHASGSWTFEKKDFYEVLDNYKIEELSEAIALSLQEISI